MKICETTTRLKNQSGTSAKVSGMQDHPPSHVSRLSGTYKNESESSGESSLAADEELQQTRMPSIEANDRIVLGDRSMNN